VTRFSRSQLYRWRRGKHLERKARECKVVIEATVENAAAVVVRSPHFGGRKGQAFMLYHGPGFIGMRAYDRIKRNVAEPFQLDEPSVGQLRNQGLGGPDRRKQVFCAPWQGHGLGNEPEAAAEVLLRQCQTGNQVRAALQDLLPKAVARQNDLGIGHQVPRFDDR